MVEHALTCFLIASKYDELDRHIPFIKDMQAFYKDITSQFAVQPSYKAIIECERKLMKFF